MFEVVIFILGVLTGGCVVWESMQPEPVRQAVACWSMPQGEWMLELDTGERVIKKREGLLFSWRHHPSMELVKPYAVSWLEEERRRLSALDAHVELQ